MAGGLPRFGVVMPVLGSLSGRRVRKLKLHQVLLPALPPQAEVRAAAVDSIVLAVAVIATVFLFRDSYNKSLAAAVSRIVATLVSFAMCLAYLAFLPFHPWAWPSWSA